MNANIWKQAISISPNAYELLNRKRATIKAQGMKVTRRELADKAIIAAYGGTTVEETV